MDLLLIFAPTTTGTPFTAPVPLLAEVCMSADSPPTSSQVPGHRCVAGSTRTLGLRPELVRGGQSLQLPEAQGREVYSEMAERCRGDWKAELEQNNFIFTKCCYQEAGLRHGTCASL